MRWASVPLKQQVEALISNSDMENLYEFLPWRQAFPHSQSHTTGSLTVNITGSGINFIFDFVML